MPVLQAELEIGPPDDRFEQEADRVADQVMRMAGPQRPGAISPDAVPNGIRRLCAECEEEVRRQPAGDEEEELQMKRASGAMAEIGPGLQAQIGGLRGGRSLPPALRAFFEPRFGHDFSKVRIHQGSQASNAARATGARAYTLGQDVVFGQGEYRPASDPGRRLIAHELTHVIQQAGAARPFVQCQGSAELSTTEGQLLPAPSPESIGHGLAEPPCSTPASAIYELQGTITSTDPACSVAGIKDLRRESALLKVYRADHPLVGNDPCPGFPGVVDASYWLDRERRIAEIDRTRVTIINICGDEEVLEIKGEVLGSDRMLDAIGGAAPSEPTPDHVVEDAQGTRGRQCAVWYDDNCDIVKFTAKSNAETPAADCDAVYRWDAAQEAYVKATDEQTGAQPVTQTPGQLERIAGIRLKTFQEGKWLATHCGDYPESHQFRD